MKNSQEKSTMDLWVRSRLQQNYDPKKSIFFYNVTRSYLNLGSEEIGEFWTQYCQSVRNGQNPLISELTRNRESVQLSFDLNLNFERQQIPYNPKVVVDLVDSIERYVELVIGVIQSMLQHYFEPSQSKSENVACYLRREENNILVWKDSVEYVGRLIFPYAHIRNEYIAKFYHFIINQLQLNGDTPDEHLAISPVNGLDTFIRPRLGEAIELYGSSLTEDSEPLRLKEVYGLLNTDIRTTFELDKAFTPVLHTVVMKGQLGQDVIMEKANTQGIAFWLPLFFSMGFFDYPLKPREGISLEMSEPPKITISVIKESGESLTKLERARQLLTFISISRMDYYWSWIDIGQALKTVDQTEGLRLWKWMTTQSDYKTEEDCDLLWPTFDGHEEVDIETLEYFASIDNPEGYENYREPEVRSAINKAITEQNHTPVAKAFKACFPHKFICSNFETGEWYMYNGTRWNYMSGTADLMWYMNEKFRPKLEQLQVEIAVKIANSRDPEFKDRNQNFHNLIGQLIGKISHNHFKKSVCEELKIYYRKDNFSQLRDRHPDYTACPTLVIDVRGGEVSKRQGKPQDYCHRCTRYDPIKDATWEHPAVKMTMNYLRQVFRSKTLLDYVLRFMGALLKSGNSNKLFPIMSGEGNNSKSVLVRIIEAALGSYAVKLPTALITGKSTGADSATPTLIHSAGAKVAFLEEPNKNEQIQSGTVKRLTGQDTQYVRDLFQKGSKIVELFLSMVPILICNKIPVIPDCQEAIWNRTRVIDFSSKWSSEAPESIEEQFRTGVFKMDKFFDRNVPIMAPALLWIMCQVYPEYFNNGLQDPPEVLQATENFRVANNFYIHFTRDCVKQALDSEGHPDMTASVTLDDLFNDFRKWYQDQQLKGKIPTKTEFKENIQIVWKIKADPDNKWYGMKRLMASSAVNTLSSLLSF